MYQNGGCKEVEAICFKVPIDLQNKSKQSVLSTMKQMNHQCWLVSKHWFLLTVQSCLLWWPLSGQSLHGICKNSEFEIFQTGPVPRGTTLACIINFMHTIQMFRAHLKAHTRLLAFFLTKETPIHERTAVRNICMRSTSRLGEICS